MKLSILALATVLLAVALGLGVRGTVFKAEARLSDPPDVPVEKQNDNIVVHKPDAADDDPFWGPEDALVTMVEFGDFQCPFSAKFATETLPLIRELYEDRVRFIYRDLPLTRIHPEAWNAAKAAQCAHEQGLFWEYHDVLFENQQALTVSDLKHYAEQVGLNTDEFNDCLDSHKTRKEVRRDVRDAKRADIPGTPSFLIDGTLVVGSQPFEVFQQVIEEALAEAGE